MAKTQMTPQNGFTVADLKLGGVYECRVSGRLCLIVDAEKIIGFQSVGPGIKTESKRCGLVYNSTNGKYDTFVPYDHQLKFPSA